VDFLPSPLDVPPIIGEHPVTHKEVLRTANDSEPFSALVFKIAADPYVGKWLTSGSIRHAHSGSYVLNATKGKKERIGRILQMHANHRRGDRDRLRRRHRRRGRLEGKLYRRHAERPGPSDRLESIVFPEPVIEVAIEPKTKADQDKLALALQRLADEDPPSAFIPTRRAVRPASPGWASCTLRFWWIAWSASSRSRPTSAGRGLLPRDDPPCRRGPRPPHQADRRQGPVRPRSHQGGTERVRQGLRVHHKIVGGYHPPRVHQSRSTRAYAKRVETGRMPAIRW